MIGHFQLLTIRAEHTLEAHPSTEGFPRAEAEWVTEPQQTLVVRVTGDIDATTVHVIHNTLQAHPASRTIIDLSGIDFADCSLLNTVVKAVRTRPIVLAGPLSRSLRLLFDFTATTTAVTVAPDLATAHTRFPPHPATTPQVA